ncbi:MAG: AMP-binding protein [Candidatus Lokiarchaeota archaeon]|nr:AMP-binding protein [Candidatus Lokiarchaeota archaeon]MBD3201573.1 AMP-binding protein [Candidatus Lokiarchaeota archaeon]
MNSEKFWLKSYDDHVSPNLDYPKEDIMTLLNRSMDKYPDRIGFFFMDRQMPFKEVQELARRFATFLQKNGLKKGDVVAICYPNTPQYLISLYGTLMAGGTATGLSPLLSPPEMVYQLDDCDAKFLITMDIVYEKIFRNILEKLPKLETIIPSNISEFMGFSSFKVFMGKLIGKVPKGKMDPYPGKKVVPFLEVLETEMDLDRVSINPQKDLALIQYTGGTTGRPKGVEIKHSNLVSNMHQFDVWLDRKSGTDITLSAFPYFHIAGLFIGLFLTYIASSHIIIANPRDTDHIIDQIIEVQPTVFGNVPTLYLLVQRNPRSKEIPDNVLDNISLYVSGAAPFPSEAIRDFEKQFHTENKFVEVYGMTESAVLVTVNPTYGKKKIGKVGLPLPDTEVKLVNVETGKEVPLGEPGEILLKGPQVTQLYHNKPEATKKTWIDGWLHTGDVGVFDEEGYLKIVDRTKDMLSVSGFKVYSVHVEEVLTKHPDIQIMAIIGLPDEDRPGSEIVKAVIQLKEGIEATENVKIDIKQYARENLAKYEIPKIWDFREELPQTMVGKVEKKALRKEEED